MIGAAPVPVPPPIPAVIKTMSAPSRHFGDSCPGLLGRFLADVRLRAGAHAARQLLTDLQLVIAAWTY